MHNNEGIRFKSSSTKVPPLSVSHPPFCSQSLTSNLSKAQSLVDQFFNSLKLPPDVNKNEGIRIQSSSIKVPSLPFRNPSSTPPLSVSRLPFCSQSLTPNLSKAQSLVDQFFNSLKCPPGVNKNEGIRFKSSSIDPSSTPPLSVSRLPFCSQSLTSTLSKAQSSVAQFFKSLKWTPGVNKCPTRAYNGLVEVKEKEALLKSGETRREGQVYSKDQGKRDVETVLSMGTMENLSIFPQPAGDSGKVDSVTNSVERVNGWFSNGGGIACGITNGPLSGLMGSFAFAHQNLFGKNQKVNVSLERGLIDSIFRLSYTDPWIQGGDNHTSRSIMIQKARRPGTLVHGNQPDGSNLTIGRLMAGIEFSRFIKPNWSGTTGITFQRAGARDDRGDPVVKDFYNSALTASGKTHDDMLVAKVESVYTSDSGSSMFGVSMEQGIPLFPGWLLFSRANSRARTGFTLGPASVLLNLSGGHVMGNFPPHEAFAIGGANSVRGYEDGAVGSGRSYVVGSGEISFPLFGPVDGAVFADYGTDLGSGSSVPGDPAGAWKWIWIRGWISDQDSIGTLETRLCCQ